MKKAQIFIGMIRGLILLIIIVSAVILFEKGIKTGADEIVEENTPEITSINTEEILNNLQESQQQTQSGQGYSCTFHKRDPSKITPEMRASVIKYLQKFGMQDKIPKEIVFAQILQESNGIPDRISFDGLSTGLMQVTPKLHHESCKKECGFSDIISNDEYFDIDKNICCGVRVLKQTYGETAQDRCRSSGCKSCLEKYPNWANYKGYQIALRGYNGWACGAIVEQYKLYCYVEEIENAALQFKST